ncbi:cell division protein FtsQ [Streptomyces spiroverticillatus]|uniref:Cell division protein FtsQ n=1 Tax=Streptomyces finlayi TaxID=67296 RepID=A0A919C9V0_9ACTN|nr:FtsQ-type POTRA domain-containing protein [Streptomyces finlayi]GGZ93128.1 cell division protein FtsQ [Streptomyces spiroverticillatus]GHC92506.1 cell division protein FtsQ [Streptomyces finlayi]
MAGPSTRERGGRAQTDPATPRAPREGRPGRLRRLRTRVSRPVVLLLAAAVLLCGGIVWALYGSNWLRVEQVRATGTRVLTPQQVLDAAAVPTGIPMISVDTGAIEDRLRKELPRIDTIDVVRSWPHGIGLKVTERKPVLLLTEGPSAAGKFTEVDRNGVRFATVTKPTAGVPRLELAATRSPSLRRFGEQRLLAEAVRVASGLPAAVARNLTVVKVTSYDAITLELGRDRSVFWGSGESGEAKSRALLALMKASPDAKHFDVSAPTAPASSGS